MDIRHCIRVGCLSLILSMGRVSTAGYTAFECDFETGVPPELSGVTTVVGTEGFAAYGLGANFLHNSTGGIPYMGTPGDLTTLTLTNLPPHTSVEICFDLAICDSWDGGPGEDWGPDYFNVSVDGSSVFQETFSNMDYQYRTFDPDPTQVIVSGVQLFNSGYNGYQDSLFMMGPSLGEIPHTASTLTVLWWASGAGWQGCVDWYGTRRDESWGIDNIKIILHGLTATVNIDPDTLDLKSKGSWITCYLELPEGYSAGDIDVSSIRLDGVLQVERSDIQEGMLMVKFDREEVIDHLESLGISPPSDVSLMVTGQLSSGMPLEGTDVIRVIQPPANNK